MIDLQLLLHLQYPAGITSPGLEMAFSCFLNRYSNILQEA